MRCQARRSVLLSASILALWSARAVEGWQQTPLFASPVQGGHRTRTMGRAEDTKGDQSVDPSRRHVMWNMFLASGSVLLNKDIIGIHPAFAFDGGVGGLGKVKPETGLSFFSDSVPIQNSAGVISAEISSASGRPLSLQFQTPWNLLPTTSGLEARDLRSLESAFVQVVPLNGQNWKDKKVFTQLLSESVFASQGKFGAYGVPIDVKVAPLPNEEAAPENSMRFRVTFTSYTPAMRESERQVWIQAIQPEAKTLVLLVTGTTRARFASNKDIFEKVADSFQVVPAPESRLR